MTAFRLLLDLKLVMLACMKTISPSPLRQSQQKKLARKRRRIGFVMVMGVFVLMGAGWMNVSQSSTPLKTNITAPSPSQSEQDAVSTVQAPTINWVPVTIQSGQSLAVVFQNMGFSALDLHNIMQAGPDVQILNRLRPGQTLYFDHQGPELTQLKLEKNIYETLVLQKQNQQWVATLEKADIEIRTAQAMVLIEDSLYLSGKNAGLSDALIMQLTEIYAWDIDFAWDIRQGDRFTLVYAQQFKDGVKITDGPVLAVEFVNQGRVKRAIRYTHEDGTSSYYDEEGHSMRKAFLRSPVDFARISSGFRLARFHPVLKRTRAHKGVDYAARTGTPIKASGDGKVHFKGRKGGYGNTVILSHGGKYTTLYAHMSRYASGLRIGSRVKQGQVIGYVGRTGLATGPHLHYEFRVHGVHRNPLTIELPKAKSIDTQEQEAFRAFAQPMFARLDNYIKKRTQVAFTQTQTPVTQPY